MIENQYQLAIRIKCKKGKTEDVKKTFFSFIEKQLSYSLVLGRLLFLEPSVDNIENSVSFYCEDLESFSGMATFFYELTDALYESGGKVGAHLVCIWDTPNDGLAQLRFEL